MANRACSRYDGGHAGLRTTGTSFDSPNCSNSPRCPMPTLPSSKAERKFGTACCAFVDCGHEFVRHRHGQRFLPPPSSCRPLWRSRRQELAPGSGARGGSLQERRHTKVLVRSGHSAAGIMISAAVAVRFSRCRGVTPRPTGALSPVFERWDAGNAIRRPAHLHRESHNGS